MGLIALSASVSKNKDKKELLYDHTAFNEAIEIVIKMLDRYERIDRVFAQE